MNFVTIKYSNSKKFSLNKDNIYKAYRTFFSDLEEDAFVFDSFYNKFCFLQQELDTEDCSKLEDLLHSLVELYDASEDKTYYINKDKIVALEETTELFLKDGKRYSEPCVKIRLENGASIYVFSTMDELLKKINE